MSASGAASPLPFAARPADSPALIMGRSGAVTTYGELDELSNQCAQLLAARGLRPGDHVAVVVENRPEFFDVVWAAQRSGLYYTPVSTHLTAGEIAYIVRDSGAKALVVSTAMRDIAEVLHGGASDVALWLSVGGPIAGYEPLDDAIRGMPTTPLDPEVAGSEMFYSSGTTGRPKAVRKPVPPGSPWNPPGYLGTYVDQYGFTAGTVWLSTGPLYHAGPLYGCLAAHRLGAVVVVMEQFDAHEALRLMERHGVTHAQWVPAMFSRLLKLPADVRAAYDLSSMQFAIHGSAPCPAAVKEQMIEWWGPIIHEFYAGTEGNGFTFIDTHEWLTHRGSVGRATLGQVRVVGNDGRVLGPHEDGLVYFEGGFDFEYLNDPEKTANAHDSRGWSTLGDIGHLDEEGYLYLTDRLDFTIISGGVNIYPREAEDVLVLHPAVADVAVIGVPHAEMGEEVKAIVEVVEGVIGDDALATELIRYCRDRLSNVKCPRSVDFVSDLPRMPSGKVRVRELREPYWEGRPSRLM